MSNLTFILPLGYLFLLSTIPSWAFGRQKIMQVHPDINKGNPTVVFSIWNPKIPYQQYVRDTASLIASGNLRWLRLGAINNGGLSDHQKEKENVEANIHARVKTVDGNSPAIPVLGGNGRELTFELPLNWLMKPNWWQRFESGDNQIEKILSIEELNVFDPWGATRGKVPIRSFKPQTVINYNTLPTIKIEVTDEYQFRIMTSPDVEWSMVLLSNASWMAGKGDWEVLPANRARSGEYPRKSKDGLQISEYILRSEDIPYRPEDQIDPKIPDALKKVFTPPFVGPRLWVIALKGWEIYVCSVQRPVKSTKALMAKPSSRP